MHVVRIGSVHQLPRHAADRRTGRYDAIGGMQTHTASLTRELARRGVRQTVLTARSWGPRTAEHPRADVTIHRLGAPVPWLRQGWALDALGVIPRLQPDLVHVHQGEDVAALPLAAALARHVGAPLVVTVHCSMVHTVRATGVGRRAARLAGAAAERRVLPLAAAVIALTPTTADLLRRWLPSDRVHVLPSGIDLAGLRRPRPDPTPGIDHPRVAYVGRLAAQKSVGTLLDAFDRMATPSSLVIVGDGPLRDDLRARASRSPRCGRIHMLDSVSHDEVAAHLQHADLLALPSRYEELGSVLLEALAVGLPTVATRVGGIPWAVADGQTGLLVPPGDPSAMAATLDRVLADRHLRQGLAAASLRRAPRFCWHDLADDVVALYWAVLDEPARTPLAGRRGAVAVPPRTGGGR